MSVWKPITEIQSFQSDVFKNAPTGVDLIFLYDYTPNIINDSTRTICSLFTEAYHDRLNDNFVDTDIFGRYFIDKSCYNEYISRFSGFKVTDLTNAVVSFFNNSCVRFDASSHITCDFVLKPYTKVSSHFESIKSLFIDIVGTRLTMPKFNLTSSDYIFMSYDNTNENNISRYKILKLDPMYPIFKNKRFQNKNSWSEVTLSTIWNELVHKDDATFIIYNHQFELVGNHYNSKISSLKDDISMSRSLWAFRAAYIFNENVAGA